MAVSYETNIPFSTIEEFVMQRETIFSRQSAPGILRRLALAVFLLACAAVVPLAAQFERRFGGGNNESGEAVDQTLTGGYIAAGSSVDASGISTVYVVCTDAGGNRIWDKTYELGPLKDAFAMDVKQCANGDFVIVGGVIASTCVSGCQHLFVMRISATGTVIWKQIMGDNTTNYLAYSVVETQLAPGGGTSAGDLVVCGVVDNYTTSSSGFLMRLTSGGAMVWVKRYDVAGTSSGPHLHSVDESRVQGTGDIIATGEIALQVNNFDVPYLRVSGADGSINAAPQGFAVHGLSGNDYGESIIELRTGTYFGDVLITGRSLSRPLPSTTHEILLIEAFRDPCDQMGTRAQIFHGDNFIGVDGGSCAVEIQDVGNGTPGEIVITGYAARNNQAQAMQAILQKFSPGTLTPASTMQTFGRNGGEAGYGLVEARTALGAGGFVLTGSTNSHSAGFADNDLYLVKADFANPTCTEVSYSYSTTAAGLQRTCPALDITLPQLGTLCGIQAEVVSWSNPICDLHGAGQWKRNVEPPSIALADNASSAMQTTPNPVPLGLPIVLEYSLTAPASAVVTVSDAAGRVVMRARSEQAAGAVRQVVGTEGWTPGAYYIVVTAGGTTRTGRVVVTDR